MIQGKEYQYKFQDRNATEEEVTQELNELYLGKDANEFITTLENTKKIDNDAKGGCDWVEGKSQSVYRLSCAYRIGTPSLFPPFAVHWGFDIQVDANKKITNFEVTKTLMG